MIGIRDELPGAVERDVAAAARLRRRSTPRAREILVAGEDVLLLRAAPERDDRIVLEEQDDVADASRVDARLDERLLERVRARRSATRPSQYAVMLRFVVTASDSSAPLP